MHIILLMMTSDTVNKFPLLLITCKYYMELTNQSFDWLKIAGGVVKYERNERKWVRFSGRQLKSCIQLLHGVANICICCG